MPGDTGWPDRPQSAREERMRMVVDALWAVLHSRAVSWIGFYIKTPGREEMRLGPCRDKPACSPIGLHGVCGRCWRERRAVVVRDVADLGSAYIACDPHDRSECVVPLFDARGEVWGVLDADSRQPGRFTDDDVRLLRGAAEGVGLSMPQWPVPETLWL